MVKVKIEFCRGTSCAHIAVDLSTRGNYARRSGMIDRPPTTPATVPQTDGYLLGSSHGSMPEATALLGW